MIRFLSVLLLCGATVVAHEAERTRVTLTLAADGSFTLDVANDVAGCLSRQGFDALAISVPHAQRAGNLRVDHRDPFDRMLIAQSQMEDLPIVSNETLFDAFGVERLW